VVNGGNTDAAIDLLCTVDDNTDKIANINEIAGNADLQIDTSTAEVVDQIVYSVDLTGSIGGQGISRGHVGTAPRDGCVVSFSASAD
jgi:hypothetical protein